MPNVKREDLGPITADGLPIGHLLVAQERIFQNIASDLHDGPVQDLIAAQFLLATLNDDDTTRAALQETLQNVTAALRAMCQSLHPPALRPFGLFKAVESLVESMADGMPGGVAIEFDPRGDEASLAPWAKQQIFRIVQALLDNVKVHARARHVHVMLAVTEQQVVLRVADDGIGCVPMNDVAAWRALAEAGQYGFFLCAARAQVLDGSFTVQTGPNGGTSAELQIESSIADKPVWR